MGGRTKDQGYSVTDGVRQGYTGNEKDGETGLNFAQARYHSPTMGPFTSVDPLHFQAVMSVDPQTINLYSDARNNPLAFVDPDGKEIRLHCDETERKQMLADLREAVGSAGELLYERKVETLDDKGNVLKVDYYVGIRETAPNGHCVEFESRNEAAAVIGKVNRDQGVVDLHYRSAGATVTVNNGDSYTMGPWKWTNVGGFHFRRGGQTGVTGYVNGRLSISLLRPDTEPGGVPAHLMTDVKDSTLNRGIVVGHEIGHVIGFSSKLSHNAHLQKSVELENKVRRGRFLTGLQEVH